MSVDELRFEFGRNWQRFLAGVDDARVDGATRSLREMLGCHDLAGRTFLDIGSGSGLFSLAARLLGARVRSFDYDPASVACTEELRRRHRPDDPEWVVEQGSVLDESFMASLGTFDVVYAWGVLHHTGAMWRALELTAGRVAPGGSLFVALYNDQGAASRRWTAIKRRYNAGGTATRASLGTAVGAYFAVRYVWNRTGGRLTGSAPAPPAERRGMSYRTDLIDWVGGHPFEVAPPGSVEAFLASRGFAPAMTRTCGRRSGCNEFVFVRSG